MHKDRMSSCKDGTKYTLAEKNMFLGSLSVCKHTQLFHWSLFILSSGITVYSDGVKICVDITYLAYQPKI